MADFYIKELDKAKLLMALVNLARPIPNAGRWFRKPIQPPEQICLADAQSFLTRNGFQIEEAFGRRLRLGGDLGVSRLNP